MIKIIPKIDFIIYGLSSIDNIYNEVFHLNLKIHEYQNPNRYNCHKNLRHFQNTLMCVVIYIVIHTIHCCLKFRDQLMLVSAVIDSSVMEKMRKLLHETCLKFYRIEIRHSLEKSRFYTRNKGLIFWQKIIQSWANLEGTETHFGHMSILYI